MKKYIECWVAAASAIFPQALAGEPELLETVPKPLAGGAFGFAAQLKGDTEGYFSVVLDAAILESPLLGEGVDQKTAWGELLRETAEAAAGELVSAAGGACRVDAFAEVAGEGQVTCALQLMAANGAWTLLVHDETRAKRAGSMPAVGVQPSPQQTFSPGVDLLLDVELDATLRFGCREMALSEILDLGAGDVVELDRHISDPVDLVVGDKIVARGEAVLVNGNFGLRITEVATPRKRLESIRCLF
jgi:flagellar motor switch protein FliN